MPLSEKRKASRKAWAERTGYLKEYSKKYKVQAIKNAKKWRDLNPDKAKNAYYKYQYGITLEQYNAILLAQNGVCAICGQSEAISQRNLSVDHNHLTGEVRGLLCLDCNSGIGHLKDNKQYLQNAINYLST